jgi:hypothetical protein
MDMGWLIYNDDEAYVFLNKSDALEMYMSLCDEEMYITFAWMTQDELANDTLEDMIFYTITQPYVDWYVKEVPIYGRFSR